MSASTVKSVLVLGSGPIVIGQAAEFDYAGTQACRALREEGVRTILVNSNPATIMTDEDVADAVYIEPLTPDVIRRVIQRERPDGLLPTIGGQTGLNLAVQVHDLGILDRYGVRMLGTPLSAIKKAEDRALFKQLLEDLGEPAVESAIVTSLDEAHEFAEHVPLPLVIRPAFTLGGTGGGVAHTPHELELIVETGLNASPINQILLERSLAGWKEIEYEVMRDGADTCITICNMENLDPMGVHTGDSIVVAPSQTLSDYEYQMLRSSALRIIRALGIEGGCNIQYALDPDSFNYSVIEVNPRVSRSSALASKATGYPIARMAAKIAIGKRLDELTNAVTGKTTAAFEPALDYVVVKIPRWPFDKFPRADRTIGTQMKATGEVMSIDRSFEGALLKAVRSLETSAKDLLWVDDDWTDESLQDLVTRPNDLRLWAVMEALRRGWDVDRIHEASRIDCWFLDKLAILVALERAISTGPLDAELLWNAKRSGFADETIAMLSRETTTSIRSLRDHYGMAPVYKMVDTCAGEFAAATPYFYSSYEEEDEATPLEGDRALVVGSGPIRIGQGIEFDYCSVQAAHALHDAGVSSIMVNSNPETVSTDFDASDRLYFEPLDAESVHEILRHEANGQGDSSMPPVIVQFGGQTAINLAAPLSSRGVEIRGSSLDSIDLAEDRKRFESFLKRLGIPQPNGAAVTSLDDAQRVAERIGYPVLVRPSYVLGGRAMEVVYGADHLARYIRNATSMRPDHPVLIDKYLLGKEVEVDAICDGEEVLVPGIMEHIERAGVHSGDSFAIYPGIHLFPAEIETIVDYTTRIAKGLDAKGLINIQYVIHSGRIYVLEVNPRSSRTVPFLSKVTGVPMVKLATNIMLGKSLKDQGYCGGLWPRQPLVAVKAPVFSMAKLRGVEVHLGPEMKSTGEVMGIDRTFEPAFYKALVAAGLGLPPKGSILLSLSDEDKGDSMEMIGNLVRLGYKLFATEGTAAMIEQKGMPVQLVTKRIGRGSPDVLEVILRGTVDGVINTPGPADKEILDGLQIRRAAVERGIPCITSLDTARVMSRPWKRQARFTPFNRCRTIGNQGLVTKLEEETSALRMGPREFTATITATEPIMGDSSILTLTAPDNMAALVRAGQFVDILCRLESSSDPLLRRPYSIYEADAENRTMSVLVRPFGRGSAWLCDRKVGSMLDVLGPLGNTFSIAPASTNLLMVAGGVGAAPLVMLSEEAVSKGLNVTYLMGAADESGLLPASALPGQVEYVVATDDGSRGHAGFVTDLAPNYARWADQVFACGPEPMFRSLRNSLGPHRIGGKPKVQLSVERTMACGLGACLGCVVETKQGMQTSCIQGPVYDMDDLIW